MQDDRNDWPYRLPLYAKDGSVRAYTLVDLEDFEWARYYSWCLTTNGYAYRLSGPRGSRVPIRLHREVMDAPDGLFVDHINRDKLDNRRENLRLVTRQQNMQNVAPHKGASSKYRNVSLNRATGKWVVTVCLGSFEDEEEAGRVALEWRMAHMSHATD